MLIIWSGTEASTLRKVLGSVIGRDPTQHRIEPDVSTIPPAEAGDVVLACGGKVLATLEAQGLTPKKRTITSLRENVFRLGQSKLLLTFDPSIVSRDYARLADITWDTRLALRLHNTGSVLPVIGEYEYVESLHHVIEVIEKRYAETGKPVDVACDLETLSTDEYNPEAWIIACSFTVEDGKSEVLYFEKDEMPVSPPPWEDYENLDYWQGLWVQINWILTSEKVSTRGANFKYDSRWMVKKWGIYCTNNKFDTLLVGSLLDENRSNSLKLHAKLFTNMGGYEDGMDKHDMGRLDLVSKSELLPYVGGDTDATYKVANVFKEELMKDKRLTNFYVNLLQPASKAFEQLERNGVLVDVPYYNKLNDELGVEISRLNEAMVAMLPNTLRIKHMASIQKSYDEGKNPLTPAILRDFLFTPKGLNLKPMVFTEKTKEASTALDHLMMFESNPDAAEFINLFREQGSASKTRSTFVIGFMKHLRSDGRFHPSYMLFRGAYGEKEDDSGTNCLVASSLLLTSNGWRRVVDVKVGDEVLTHAGAWKQVTALVDNGVRKVYAVTTKRGHVVKCTGNHKFYTPTGWVQACSLAEGASVYSYGGVEVWVSVAGFPLYEVSSWGRVRNSETSRIVKDSAKGDWGHRKVTLVRGDRLRKSGNRKDFSVHRLVASHFVPNNEEMPEVRHIDGMAGNNCAWNLAWGTSEDNSSDARGHGTLCREGQSHAKLDWLKVAYIRAHEAGYDQHLASELGVSRELVRDVRLGKKWVTPSENTYSYMWGVDTILSVEFIGELPTYDATVEGDHSYVVNGLVTHNTGRTSAKDPAVQTIPKHTKWTKRLRRAFIAPPGMTILELDFSQGELRIAAVVAEEPTMLQAYMNGLDLHAITAAAMNGYDFDEFMLLPEDVRDELRSGGKAGNFGLLYGMQHLGFQAYAWNTYGVKMTVDEAQTKRTGFFEKYSRLLEWHDECKKFAHTNGFVRSPLGRVRHLPLINSKDREMVSQAERQSINSPIQATLSDMMQLAMSLILKEYGHSVIKMFMMTHDSLGLYVPIEDATLWATRIKAIMENLPLHEFGWRPSLKFLADAQVALPDADGVISMASMSKLKNI